MGLGFLKDKERATHTYMIGQPGTGKSKAIACWSLQDAWAGRGMGLIDPTQDTFEEVASHLAYWVKTKKRPQEAFETIVINPLDPTWAVGNNPIDALAHMSEERLASFLTETCVKIWKLDPKITTRMTWILMHTIFALAELGLTLLELPLFLRNDELRCALVKRLKNQEVRSYFLSEFPQNPRLRTEWIQPVLNKMGKFVWDEDIRPIIGQRRSTISFRDIIDLRKKLLVNIPIGGLGGEENAMLFGALIVAQLEQAAYSRVGTQNRPPFYLYLDEFQNYDTDNVPRILSQSRKYALRLTLAHQYLGQIKSDDLKEAVLNLPGVMVCFRVGYHDAEILAKEVLRPDPNSIKRKRTKFRQVAGLYLPYQEIEWRTLPEEWERLTQVLTNLKQREFVIKKRGPDPPSKQRTLDMPDPPLSLEEAMAILVDGSKNPCYRLKSQVRHELEVERPRLIERLAKGEYEEPSLWEEA